MQERQKYRPGYLHRLYEFAHILTGYSAGIGNIDMEQSSDIERYCDKIAASLLVQEGLFRNLWSKESKKSGVLWCEFLSFCHKKE